MESNKHTWYNLHAHIFRSDSRCIRATLKQLVIINKSAIYIKAEFLDDHGKICTKDMSPVTVAALQVLWENVDVVSDVELPDDLENETNFVAPRECDRLPILEVSYVPCTATKCMLLEVNHFMGMSTISTPVPLLPPPPKVRAFRRKSTRRRKVRGSD